MAPGASSPFERLPDELIGQILAFLDTTSIISLHRVSSRLRSVSRFDGLVWRSYCLPGQLASRSSQLPGNLSGACGVPLRSPHPRKSATTAATPLTAAAAASFWSQPYLRRGEEDVIDWYKEYQYRNAKLGPNSFVKFRAPGGLDIVDIALASNGDNSRDLISASALEDGSICIFSLRDSEVGKVLGKSRPGLLGRRTVGVNGLAAVPHGNATNRDRGLCVEAATASGNRAWFGTGSILTEIDLVTMQKVRTHRFPFSVTCLSAVEPIMAVGTTLTLHLLDARSHTDSIATTSVSTPGSAVDGEKVDQLVSRTLASPSRQRDPSGLPAGIGDNDDDSSRDHLLHAPPTVFLQPSPLSIIHSPSDQASGNELYVAGRFPSIMAYDRRFWPRLAGTMHSGGRLSGLSLMNANPWIPLSSKYALVACGEYGGRGTLEIYPLPSAPQDQGADTHIRNGSGSDVQITGQSVRQLYSKATTTALRNRQSASRCKIFSVANQGIKIVTGDGEGRIRFIERNGVTHVRDWACPSGGGVRKILPLLPTSANHRPSTENADLLLQLDEDVGVLTFGNGCTTTLKPEPITNNSNLQDENNIEHRYMQVMRDALEHHNSERMFLRGLGL